MIAVVGDQERATFCRELGAEIAINHHEGPLASLVRAATDGRGADLLYDPVGGPMAEISSGTALHAQRPPPSGGVCRRTVADRATHDLVLTNTSLVGVYRAVCPKPSSTRSAEPCTHLVAEGALRSAVTATPAFDELPTAVQRLADRSAIGKMVMVR